MLSESNQFVLKRILQLCPQGYKILSKSDFNNMDIDYQIKYLCEQGYVSLKYYQNGEYLLTPLEKGKNYFEKQKDDLISRSVLCERVARYSFYGSLLGCLILGLIILFLGWIFYAN